MKRMHFEQFYVRPEDISDHQFILRNEEAHHSIKVMRNKIGDFLAAADGKGRVVSGKIIKIESDIVIISRDQTDINVGEPEIFLTLAQGIPKGSHFDWVIEKGTEIGVSCFQPLLTERCIIDPNSRLERWSKKAFAAMKQCGRSRCPGILPACTLEQFLNHHNKDKLYIAHETTLTDGIPESIKSNEHKYTSLMIGPEGGFTPQEYKLSIDKGALPLSLGPRRLRSETAALVGIIQILSANGEL